MKYADEWERARTLIAKKHPFKGGKNYFADSLLYQDSLETDENLQSEESDSSNEVDMEPNAEEKCLWKIYPLIMSVDKLDFSTTANVQDE